MTFQTKGGYVFPSVILILTLIISTLVYSASLQKSNVEIINNFKKNLIVEEEIKAIELVILDYLNKLYKSNKDLSLGSNFERKYETTSNGIINVNLTISDDCFNVNSLVYRNANNQLVLSELEFKRAQLIFKKSNIKTDYLINIIDWIDEDQFNFNGVSEDEIYLKNNVNWKPRNNLAITNEELFMIPSAQNTNKLIRNIICANLYTKKINIKKLSEKKLSLYLPFLDVEQSKKVLNIIQKEFWLNSNIDNKTENNIANLVKEIEYVLGRGLKKDEEKFLKNIDFVSKSIEANITYQTKDNKKYYSFSKFEVNQEKNVKIIYRYGPFLKINI